MSSENLVKEKILFECAVSANNKQFDTLLILSNLKITFEKKKGLIKKKYVTVDEVLLEDIKIIKNKVSIEQDNSKVTLNLKEDKVYFYCESEKEAKKIVSEIKKILLGPIKKEKFLMVAKGAAGIVGAAITSGAVVDAVNAVKDKDIKSAAKAVSKFADKI